MLLRLIRFFRGYVTFKITGRFPERFINLALKNGIGIFDAVPTDGTLRASMVISDYRVIRNIARRSGVKLRIISRHGLPFITFKFRYRWGLAAGFVMFIILSLLMQTFVWSVEINGIKTLSETDIIASLHKAGFKEGRFKGNLDLHKIEREILLEYKEIGWMSINLMGTHAEIEIKEKTLVPEKEYSADFSNIVASSDGVILSTNISRGTAEVKAGSAVSEGQLLVSGIYENALGELHFVDAQAEVVASTIYNFSASVDEAVTYNKPVSLSEREEVELFWFSFPVSYNPQKYPFTSYNESSQVYLYDNPVPLVINSQKLYSYEPTEKHLTEKDARLRLSTELSLYKLFNLKDAFSVTDTSEFCKSGKSYILKSKILCTENIAKKENLVVNAE